MVSGFVAGRQKRMYSLLKSRMCSAYILRAR